MSTWPAIAASRVPSVSALRKSAQSAIDNSATSAIDLAPKLPAVIVTARISGLRRVPLHSGHGTSRMKPSRRSFICSESV